MVVVDRLLSASDVADDEFSVCVIDIDSAVITASLVVIELVFFEFCFLSVFNLLKLLMM